MYGSHAWISASVFLGWDCDFHVAGIFRTSFPVCAGYHIRSGIWKAFSGSGENEDLHVQYDVRLYGKYYSGSSDDFRSRCIPGYGNCRSRLCYRHRTGDNPCRISNLLQSGFHPCKNKKKCSLSQSKHSGKAIFHRYIGSSEPGAALIADFGIKRNTGRIFWQICTCVGRLL